MQAIQRQLEEVEERQRASEIQGVRLEKALRGEAGRLPENLGPGLWSENSAGLTIWAKQGDFVTLCGCVSVDRRRLNPQVLHTFTSNLAVPFGMARGTSPPEGLVTGFLVCPVMHC